MTVEISDTISPAPRDIWQQVHGLDPYALVTQSPAWLDCICATGPYSDASRYYQFIDGVKAVLPLAAQRHMPARLANAASPPHGWGIGGLISSGELTPEHLTAIVADLARLPYLRLSVRPNPLSGTIWAATQHSSALVVPRRAHVIDLSGGFDVVWSKRYEKSTRTSIRKAERSGLVVDCDTSSRLVQAFHELYLSSLERWGQQQHEPRALTRWRGLRRDPLAKLQNITRYLAGNSRIYMAWLDGKPIAATLLLLGRNAHATRSVMNKELAGPVRASDLLHNMAIKDACEAGCRHFHMGESGASVSLARFKRGFGAEEHAYAEYRFELLPLTAADSYLRTIVKRIIGFRDTTNEEQPGHKETVT